MTNILFLSNQEYIYEQCNQVMSYGGHRFRVWVLVSIEELPRLFMCYCSSHTCVVSEINLVKVWNCYDSLYGSDLFERNSKFIIVDF
jgi:hypothetical protein